jgi:hypothetical protein
MKLIPGRPRRRQEKKRPNGNDPNADDLRKPLINSDDDDECILIRNPGALDETVNEVDENQEVIQLVSYNKL